MKVLFLAGYLCFAVITGINVTQKNYGWAVIDAFVALMFLVEFALLFLTVVIGE